MFFQSQFYISILFTLAFLSMISLPGYGNNRHQQGTPPQSNEAMLQMPGKQHLSIPGMIHRHHQKIAPQPEAPEVTLSIVVKAKPNIVWQAIQHERLADPRHRKLLSYDGTEAVLEEKFIALPIIGAAICTYVEHEVPMTRIDYKMLHSNRFAVFAGRWQLTPDENNTVVELSNIIDPGIRVPFWQELTKTAALRNIKKRLAEVAAYTATIKSSEI